MLRIVESSSALTCRLLTNNLEQDAASCSRTRQGAWYIYLMSLSLYSVISVVVAVFLYYVSHPIVERIVERLTHGVAQVSMVDLIRSHTALQTKTKMATMLATTGMRSARRAVGAAARHQRFAIRAAPLQVRSVAALFPLTSGSGASSPLFTQIKLMSTSSSAKTTDSSENDDDDEPAAITQKQQEPVLIYAGPMSRAVRLMKGVSVTSCILTSIGMPTLCLISEQSASMVGKVRITCCSWW